MNPNQALALRDRICLMTGATSGIGKAAARELSRLGATLLIVGRDPRRAEETRTELIAAGGPGPVELMPGDLASQASLRELVLAV
ncbi:MAG TPA: SDR family NAD(P)-dependent oxidoreductase, partial [Candidatus Polarisedimenticolia bacterium]|nr:SDR family NAD(P)-dependent oxidoreductase [Candidatus Polarisedimenticolia bacterium]